jgi:hypothetical protein
MKEQRECYVINTASFQARVREKERSEDLYAFATGRMTGITGVNDTASRQVAEPAKSVGSLHVEDQVHDEVEYGVTSLLYWWTFKLPVWPIVVPKPRTDQWHQWDQRSAPASLFSHSHAD